LPRDIWAVSVESQKVYEFSETLSPAVAAAIPQAIIFIKNLLLESVREHEPQKKK